MYVYNYFPPGRCSCFFHRVHRFHAGIFLDKTSKKSTIDLMGDSEVHDESMAIHEKYPLVI